jgi:hypothetical protein
MDCLLRVQTGPTGEVVLPEQAFDTIDAFWIPKDVEQLSLLVGTMREVVCEYVKQPEAEARLFGGVIHRKWVPVTPNLPMYAVTRQAIFLRSEPKVGVWLEGVTPCPGTFVTRTIVNTNMDGGAALQHQCRPLHVVNTVCTITNGRLLYVSHGFAYVRDNARPTIPQPELTT